MALSQAQAAPAEVALDLVIFGGSGDLFVRKLLPALYACHHDGRLPPGCRILGVGRQAFSREQFVQFVEEHSRKFIKEPKVSEPFWQSFLARLHYVTVDATIGADFLHLAGELRDNATRVFYLATAPTLFTGICHNLAAAKLITADSRVVLEKPLGRDLASAVAINEAVGKVFAESQIYRIDHYLGKETVQNLMALRFGNSIFEPLWRAPTIRSIQITVAETVGVGTRGAFYDNTGAMRDMVQNHLLQLLCIIAMEPPASLDPDAVRDEKLKILRSLKKLTAADVGRHTVRGQYVGGTVDGEKVPGYLKEEGIPPQSHTETFVAIQAHVQTWRWANVPFFLRTGKRMSERLTEIVINFAELPHLIFTENSSVRPNRLVIRLQPDESVRLHLMAKEPGDGMRLRPVSLDLDFNEAFTNRRADAYERLLMDVIRGRLTLFMRRDELEAAWSYVEPILDGWDRLGEAPRPYAAGTWGPGASSALIAREGSQWPEEA